MNKLITLFAAAAIAALPLGAAASEPEAAAKTETKEYRLSGFTGLDISWAYQVELTRASKHSVRVEAPDFMIPYLKVKVSDGKLKLGTEDMPLDIRRRMESSRNQVKAYITMPAELTGIEMSGASKLTASGEFSTRREFDLELSGATQVSNLSVKAAKAEIECNGAAKLELSGQFDKLDIELSGAAGVILKADAKELEMELAGAAKLALTGKTGRMKAELGGAANLLQEGSIDQFILSGAGAAKIDVSSAPADHAEIRLSGASKAIIAVQKELSVHLAGASTCNYKPGKALRITNQSVSRGSHLASF